MAALAAAGCNGERATWYQDVAPLLAERCNGCHRTGGIGPFPLDDYKTARANAARMMHQIEIGAMPPFDVAEAEDCTPRFGWKDDPRLSEEEKATLRAWIEQDFAIGQPAEVPAPARLELAGATTTIRSDEGFAASGPRDQFVCFLLDPQLGDDVSWLTGWQVHPEVPEVVHHVVLNRLPPGEMQDRLVAAHGIGRPYGCEVSSAGDLLIHTWVPGNQPVQLPPDVGTRLEPGTLIGMQVHYHAANRTHAADHTAVELRITSERPRKSYLSYPIGNLAFAPHLQPGPGDEGDEPIFKIPADATEHTETMRYPLPPLAPDVRILSVTPHAHMVATHTSAKLTRATRRGKEPVQECLSNGPWNFDWQRTYTYDAALDELPSLAEGDLFELQCKWNNSLSNPFVPRVLADVGLPPRPVDLFYGEETINEMCVMFMGILIDEPPSYSQGSAAEKTRTSSSRPL